MAVATVVAQNVQAAIGCKFPGPGSSILYYASFYGSLSEVDLNSHTVTAIGANYQNPEDVALDPQGNLYLTERAGNLLRLTPGQLQSGPNRNVAVALAQGM